MALSTDVLTTYAKIDETKIDQLLQKEISANQKKIVVLDDDPTGVQTVHDISVYTDWTKDSIRQGFQEKNNLFYILTNSRGFTQDETTLAHNEIAANVDAVAKELGKEYIFISRSDSTLRGHYPLETEILRTNYEKNTGCIIDGEILCPFFKEGGRFTIDDVHYVRYGNELIPANETEFAKDKTFGYRAATMPEYVEEKTKGAYPAGNVVCISLDEIHRMAIDEIEQKLLHVQGFNKIIVNAVDYADLKVFCVALYRAMAKGKVFMFRTAAAIVKVMGGVSDQPLLEREQMVRTNELHGGIIVVGSHTEKTTRQLEALKQLSDIRFVELDATKVTVAGGLEKEVERCLALEEAWIRDGKTVCCYTSRALVTADTGNKEDELRLSVRISDAVQSLVGGLSVIPKFVIAKGGITSSDVGTKALGVKRANVLGQIEPGIPVWQTGAESKFPGIPYVIFPGNVGEDTTLRYAVEKLI
ncbi:MAG: four-carbon acid sugar kinase family protein [Lachnospiraceae bacterium]